MEKAIIFAKKWHGDQPRKTGEPFYSHPLAVAKIASEYYFKTDVLVACILHDTLEDCKGCDFGLIIREFNVPIAQMVLDVTKVCYGFDSCYVTDDNVIKLRKGKKTILTLEEILRKLHATKDYESLFIKDMDRIHNMKTIEGHKPEKQRKVAEETTNIMLGTVANICEKLGIEDRKYEIEERLFKFTNKVLKKKE